MPMEVLKMALDNILSNKFRSVLTILGIVIGIITAIVVASILTGVRQSIVAIVEEYGSNNIYAFHFSTGFGPPNRDERNRKPLTEDDANAILAQASAVQDIAQVAVNIGSWGSGFDDNMVYEGKNYRWALTDGVTPIARNSPRIPPTMHSNDDSIKNCSKICLRVAPIAFLKPTSKVLSVTETSMMFITTMPPTTRMIAVIGKTTAAIAPVN